MYLTERSHSTRCERCRTSASGIADADGCGIALTFATIGTTGSWKCRVCMNAARSGPIRPMSGKWNGAEMRSGTTFRAPCLVSASLARATLRSEEHTSELQSHSDLVCRLLLEKKKT